MGLSQNRSLVFSRFISDLEKEVNSEVVKFMDAKLFWVGEVKADGKILQNVLVKLSEWAI